MSSVARGGGTNHRRADNKETRSNWIMVGAAILRLGVEWWSVSWSVLAGLSLVRVLGAAIHLTGWTEQEEETQGGRRSGRKGQAGLCIP